MALIYTQLAEDLFQRPDEEPLDPTQWTPNDEGDGDLAVVSEQCVPGTLGFGNEVYTGVAIPDDQYAEAVLATWDTATGVFGVGVQADLTEESTGAFACDANGDGTSTFSLFVSSGASPSVVMPDPSPGDVFRIEITGTIIRALYNGTAILSVNVAGLNPNRIAPIIFLGGAVAISAFREGSITNTTPNILVCDGDSITAGFGVTTPFTASLGLQGDTWQVHNVAISGENLATMLANAPTTVDPLFSPGVENVVHILAGLNDLDQGTLPSNLITLLWEYCDGRRAVGFKVIVATLLSASPPLDAFVQEYNALVLAGYKAHADGISRIGDNQFLGILGAYADSTYFQNDGRHPTQLSDTNILAPIVSEQVNNITNTFQSNQLALDNFSRADETPLQPPWITPVGGVGLNLSSDLAVGTNASGDSADYYSTLSLPDDQWAEVVIGNAPAQTTYIGPAVRIQTDVDSYYGLFVQPNQNGVSIFRWDAGVGTDLIDFAFSGSFGNRFRLVVIGSTLFAYANGALLGSIDDSTYVSGRAGIVGFNAGAAASEWTSGNLNHTISGNVGLARASVALSGDESDTTTADSVGGYFFDNLPDGDYVITPTQGGVSFSPTNSPQTVSGADITGVNFTAQSTNVSASHSVDLDVSIDGVKSHSADLFVAIPVQENASHSADLVVQENPTPSHSVDLFVLTAFVNVSANHGVDLVVGGSKPNPVISRVMSVTTTVGGPFSVGG
jgi:hypothetical protein